MTLATGLVWTATPICGLQPRALNASISAAP